MMLWGFALGLDALEGCVASLNASYGVGGVVGEIFVEVLFDSFVRRLVCLV